MQSHNVSCTRRLEDLDRRGGRGGHGLDSIGALRCDMIGEGSTVSERNPRPALAVEHAPVREDLPNLAREALRRQSVGTPQVLYSRYVVLNSYVREGEGRRHGEGPEHLADSHLLVQEQAGGMWIGHSDCGDAHADVLSLAP